MKMIYENFSSEVFNGLYESVIFDSDTFYNIQYGVNIPEGYEIDFRPNGYEEFKKEVLESFTSNLQTYCYSNDLIDLRSIKPHSVWSPKEYNFYTDHVLLKVEFNLNKLKKYCFKTKKKEFEEYLNKTWSSRDGFWSFIPNNLYRFLEEYKTPKKDELIEVMFEFFLLQEVDLSMVNYAVAEDVRSWLWCNFCLVRQSDWSYWDYKIENDEYIVTEKIA